MRAAIYVNLCELWRQSKYIFDDAILALISQVICICISKLNDDYFYNYRGNYCMQTT